MLIKTGAESSLKMIDRSQKAWLWTLPRIVLAHHVIVGDVNVGVADSTELDVKSDIVVAGNVSLDLNLLKNPVRALLSPRHSCVHVSHRLQYFELSKKMYGGPEQSQWKTILLNFWEL